MMRCLKELRLNGCRINHEKEGLVHSLRSAHTFKEGVNFTTHPHLLPKLRMAGFISPLFHAPKYPP